MTAIASDMPPFVVAQDLISRATAKGVRNPHRVAEVEAWEQQRRHGGKDEKDGPFWAQVVGEIDKSYRKSLGHEQA